MVRYIKNLCREAGTFYFCKRVFSFFLIMLFFLFIYLGPVRQFSIRMQYPAAPWGILFLFSAVYFNLVFTLGAIYLYSKVPFMEREQMYRFIRFGKNKWMLAQIAKIFISSFLYVGTVFVCSIAIMAPHLEFQTDWGKLYYTLALTNVQEKEEFMFAVSYRLINEYRPIPLLLLSFLVISLIVCFLGLLMFFVSLLFSRIVAIITATFLAIAPVMIENANEPVQKLMVEVIPTEWMKIAKIGDTSFFGVLSPDFQEIIIRLLVLILLLIVLIFGAGWKKQFDWYGEE